MTDLHARFRSLDRLTPPDLWREIEQRAVAAPHDGRSSLPTNAFAAIMVATAAVLLVALAVTLLARPTNVGPPPVEVESAAVVRTTR